MPLNDIQRIELASSLVKPLRDAIFSELIEKGEYRMTFDVIPTLLLHATYTAGRDIEEDESYTIMVTKTGEVMLVFDNYKSSTHLNNGGGDCCLGQLGTDCTVQMVINRWNLEMGTGEESDIYFYYINLDERGEFHADVRDANDNAVFATNHEIFEDGFMRDKHDLDGLREYLIDLGLLTNVDELVIGD